MLCFMVDQLRQRDQCIRAQCEEKMKVYGDMVELFGKEDAPEKVVSYGLSPSCGALMNRIIF